MEEITENKGLVCPTCGNAGNVSVAWKMIRSDNSKPGRVLRQRECKACGNREWTAERFLTAGPEESKRGAAHSAPLAESIAQILLKHGSDMIWPYIVPDRRED